METKTFKGIRLFLSFVNSLLCLLSLGALIYLLIRFPLFTIEKQTMRGQSLTIYNCVRIVIIFDLTSSLSVIYALNIASKPLMKIIQIYLVITQAIVLYFVYYFSIVYKSLFSRSIENRFYSGTSVDNALISYYPGLDDMGMIEACINQMNEIRMLFVKYSIISIGVLLLTLLVLVVIRSIRIEEERKEIEKPVFTELSKVGMNTVSLRAKRVVVS